MKNNSLCITPGLTGGSLAGNYLFAEVAARINEYKKSGPTRVIDLSIGDVTLPLPRPRRRRSPRRLSKWGPTRAFADIRRAQDMIFCARRSPPIITPGSASA